LRSARQLLASAQVAAVRAACQGVLTSTGLPPRESRLTGAAQGGCLLRLLTGRDRCRLPAAGRLPGVTPADRVMALAVADLWPGHRRRRAVMVKPARASLSAASTSRGGQGAHDVTDPGIGAVPGPARRLASGTGGFYRIPDTPSTRRVIRTTAMMTRPMRAMARSLPVTPG
jgi:hypothetical protein